MPARRRSTPPFLYDLVMQGPLETLVFGPRRRKVIGSVSGLVLEIGAGTGLTLRHYSPAARVVATEPDAAGLSRLQERANKSAATVYVAAADAMCLPFADDTFDALVCNLALCTIADPRRALEEAVRVLKPGAQACFLEHVRGDSRWQGRVQDALAPMWARVAGGCRLNQDTERVIREAGLVMEWVEQRRGLLFPMKLIWARSRLGSG